MTQEAAPLDERGLEAATDRLLNIRRQDIESGSLMRFREVAAEIIRAYLQTAAADVSGLAPVAYRARHSAVEKWCLFSSHVGWWECQPLYAASTLQTLSARNAALEAENERLREEREACIAEAANYCWMRYKGRYPLNLHSPAVFTSHEHQCIEEHIRAVLSSPKGGQDHG